MARGGCGSGIMGPYYTGAAQQQRHQGLGGPEAKPEQRLGENLGRLTGRFQREGEPELRTLANLADHFYLSLVSFYQTAGNG